MIEEQTPARAFAEAIHRKAVTMFALASQDGNTRLAQLCSEILFAADDELRRLRALQDRTEPDAGEPREWR
jgi:hypothetical protein